MNENLEVKRGKNKTHKLIIFKQLLLVLLFFFIVCIYVVCIIKFAILMVFKCPVQ